jgi:hypothetical protein
MTGHAEDGLSPLTLMIALMYLPPACRWRLAVAVYWAFWVTLSGVMAGAP